MPLSAWKLWTSCGVPVFPFGLKDLRTIVQGLGKCERIQNTVPENRFKFHLQSVVG